MGKKSLRDSRKIGVLVLLGIAMAIAAGWYLITSRAFFALGFPLDDAWIHHTYARNLATHGEWAFQPGEVSTGSTSPLWTILLAIGYAASFPPVAYSFVLGALVLMTIVWLIGQMVQSRAQLPSLLYSGLLLMVIFEWHLVWAALSGMETLLLGLHVLLILVALDRDWDVLLVGALAGFGVWIRPDALLTLVPIAWVLITKKTGVRQTTHTTVRYAIGFGLMLLPYLAMNFLIGGEWWPSTFYAKQLEYAVLRDQTLIKRFLTVSSAPFTGAGFLLLPGVIVSSWESIRTRRWHRMAGLIWILVFITAYALRLPVGYQHGRYMIPMIPALFLLAYDGLTVILRNKASGLLRIVMRSWLISLPIVTLIFWLKGAEAYATDVAFIESEMVAASRWINENTDPEDLIAAHDIGALGYYGERNILDLAGLISPDVVPIIRDEASLRIYLDEQGAEYLMTFPGWYPELTRDRSQVYSTGAFISPSIGGENMTIYRWP